MSIPVCPRRGLIAVAALALSACAGLDTSPPPKPLLDYQPESFGASEFSHRFAVRASRACEAARRALLSQGYVVTEAAARQVAARKFFQPDAVHHVQLEFKVVCAREAGDGAASVAFVSGLKEQYVMRRTKDSASVGVGAIGSLSLPVEGGLDALVKMSSETVVDPQLYERFFALVDAHLERAVDTPPPEAAASSPPAAAPAPPPMIVLVPQPMPQPPAVISPPEIAAPPPPQPLPQQQPQQQQQQEQQPAFDAEARQAPVSGS